MGNACCQPADSKYQDERTQVQKRTQGFVKQPRAQQQQRRHETSRTKQQHPAPPSDIAEVDPDFPGGACGFNQQQAKPGDVHPLHLQLMERQHSEERRLHQSSGNSQQKVPTTSSTQTLSEAAGKKPVKQTDSTGAVRKIDASSSLDDKKKKPSLKSTHIRVKFPMDLQVQADCFISPENVDDLFEGRVKIGQGVSSHIFKAINRTTREVVVLKKFKAKIGSEKDHEFLDIFKELQILSMCDHDNVIKYYGSFQRQDKVFACIGFCSGSCIDLLNGLKRGLIESEIAAITSQLLQGIAYLHKERIVHRDMKCGNVLLSEDGRAIIADFGVSALLNDDDDRCHTFVGSPYWIAPEVIMAMDDGAYYYPADIWSLAITVMEMAKQKPPLFEMNAMSALFHIPESAPPKLPADEDWSSDMHSFLDKCLQQEPEDRWTADKLLSHSLIEPVIEANIGTAKLRSLLISTKSAMDKTVDVTKLAEQIEKEGKSSAVAEARRQTVYDRPDNPDTRLTSPTRSRTSSSPGKHPRDQLSLHGPQDSEGGENEEEQAYMKKMRQKSMKNPKRKTKKKNKPLPPVPKTPQPSLGVSDI